MEQDEGFARVDSLVAIEGIDALGLCRLSRRSPTLGGSVPVRVAQGCVPLLLGNALGLQVTLTRPLQVISRWGGFSLEPSADSDLLRRAHEASLTALVAQGHLERGGVYHRMLAEGPLVSRRGRLLLFTGLLLRPKPGFWVWAAGAANRRNVMFDVKEVVLPDSEHFVPLCLELRPKPDVRSLRLEGEIATLLPLWPRASFSRLPLSSAEEVGRAHLDFYDAAYFAAKKAGEVTRKYRRLFGSPSAEGLPREDAHCHVIEAGPVDCAIEPLTSALLRDGPSDAIPSRFGHVERVVYRNTIPFSARFEGLSVDVRYDKRDIERAARDVEARFESTFGPGTVEAHRGALWYLTKYFTPHPAGEPHFFLKPWAFTRTPPGFSSVIEGIHGPTYDILRGVVRTDAFFATPAVFHLWRPGETIEVEAGRPLISVLPVPRALIEAEIDLSRPEALPRLG